MNCVGASADVCVGDVPVMGQTVVYVRTVDVVTGAVVYGPVTLVCHLDKGKKRTIGHSRCARRDRDNLCCDHG